MEIAVTQTMVDRVERRFDLRRATRLIARCSNVRWIATSHRTCRWDKSSRPNGTFSRADFVFGSTTSMFARVVRT